MTNSPKFSTTMAWNKTHWVVQFYCDGRLVSENTLTQGVTICPKDLKVREQDIGNDAN